MNYCLYKRFYKLTILSFIFLSINIGNIYSQNATNNVWAFGHQVGLNFNNNPPTSFLSRSFAYGSNASVSDVNGQLLMYASGDTIYNANNVPMPNGFGILNLVPGSWTPSMLGPNVFMSGCSQGNLIVPKIGSTTQYYVFALEGYTNGLEEGRLFYSVVDMTLDGGLGDVVTNQKGILLDQGLDEKLTAVPGTCGNVWVIVHPQNANEFKAYKIDENGINTTPVISEVTETNFELEDYLIGEIRFSKDGTKMVALNHNFDNTHTGAKLFDFDRTTGLFSNPVDIIPREVITAYNTNYSACFSNSGDRLYISQDSSVFQFDLSLPNISDVIASKTVVGNSSFRRFVGMKMGPDDKIYIKNMPDVFGFFSFTHYMDVINNPEGLGAACDLVYNQVGLTVPASPIYFPLNYPIQISGFGLPNDIVLPSTIFNSQVHDTVMCDTLTLSSTHTNGENYTWSTGGNTKNITITTPGTYWVMAEDVCLIDTFHVTAKNILTPSISLRDTTLCNESSGTITLTATVENALENATYKWLPEDAIVTSSGNTAKVNIAKTDYVTLTVSNPNSEDFCGGEVEATSHIYLKNLNATLHDTIICRGDPINIPVSVSASDSATILWSNGNNEKAITITELGTFWVTITDDPCFATDTITISDYWCDCQILVPNVFTPNGDGLNDYFKTEVVNQDCYKDGYLVVEIFNRWGQVVYHGTNEIEGWDGTLNGKPCDVGVYFYNIKYNLGKKGTDKVLRGELSLIR